MLEIVHDLAPGAALWFGNFATGLDFVAAVTCLAANTDVVIDDTSFFNEGPYDGTSYISANTSGQLAKATNSIRGYATSVGNFARDHYREAFADSGSSLTDGVHVWELHRFDATAGTTDAGQHVPCPSGSATCGNTLFLESGGTVDVFLQWDDPFSGSNNDHDLFLYDEAAASFVAQSTNSQTGTQPPVEMFSFTNPHAGGYFDLFIGRLHGLARTLSLFVHCSGCHQSSLGTTMNFNTSASSVPIESDAGGGVLSVGAIDAHDPGNVDVEPFSAHGPTAFNAANQIQTATVPCIADAITLCIDNLPGDSRFEIKVHFSSPARKLGGDASATSLSPLGITEGGVFAFFSATNPELLIKVLNGCGLGGHHWVFFAAVTDVGFTVTVRDTVTGDVRTYSNPDQHPASPIQDTSAFAC